MRPKRHQRRLYILFILLMLLLLQRGPGSSVGIATATGWTVRGSNPSSSSKISHPSPETPITPRLPKRLKTHQVEGITWHPQTPRSGQIPGCALTLPIPHSTWFYQYYECGNPEIPDRVEKTTPLVTKAMDRNMCRTFFKSLLRINRNFKSN